LEHECNGSPRETKFPRLATLHRHLEQIAEVDTAILVDVRSAALP